LETLGTWLHEPPRLVLNKAKNHFVLQHIGVLDIADCAASLHEKPQLSYLARQINHRLPGRDGLCPHAQETNAAGACEGGAGSFHLESEKRVSLALMPLLGIALNGTSSVLYGTITDFVRSDRQARAFGAFYTLGSIAGGTAPLFFGATSDWFGLSRSFITLGVLVLMTLPIVVMMRPHLSGARSQLA
jgi:hypothetical protein